MGPMKAPLAAAFLRLFTVQGSWNYERMIGVGMGVAENRCCASCEAVPTTAPPTARPWSGGRSSSMRIRICAGWQSAPRPGPSAREPRRSTSNGCGPP